MKCNNCSKKLDEVDCSCEWCTFCGTIFDINALRSSFTKIPEADRVKSSDGAGLTK